MTMNVAQQAHEQRSRSRREHLVGFLRDYGATRVNSRLIDERRCIPPYVVLDWAREGLFGLQIDEQYGGLGLTHRDTFHVFEQASAVDPNLLLLLSVHHAIGTPPIREFAQQAEKERVLPLLASGQSLATIAASEPGAGAHLLGIQATARKLPDGSYVLSGQKCWISLGAWAGFVNVFAQLVDEEGQPRGLTGFLVPQGTPGFCPGAEALTLGMKGIPQNWIALRDLHLGPEALLGAEGQGAAVAQGAFMLGRALVAINSVGAMKRCLQVAARYARRRTVATGVLFDNGLSLELLNDGILATRAVERLSYHIADCLDRGEAPPPILYLAAKIAGSELMWRVIDRSVQMLGARGFLDTNVVGQYFRDMRLLRIFEGPSEAMAIYLGATILKDESRILGLIESRLSEASSHRLKEAFDETRALFAQRSAARFAERQARELLCARLGELSAWSILEAVQPRSSDDDPLGAQVRGWCAHQFDRVVREIRAQRAHIVPLASRSFVADQIDAFERDIGFVHQTMAGEERDMDPMLR